LSGERENVKFLPKVRIPEGIEISPDMSEVTEGAEVIVLAVPSQYMRAVLEKLKGCTRPKRGFISATKGIEHGTLCRMSEVIGEVVGDVRMGALSGPTIAYEVAKALPSSAVIASKDARFAREARDLLMTESFRIYTSADVTGVELGGSLKNVIAIASGIADGLGFGSNTKAALLTRGIHEMTRLGVAMGARKETFSGLSCLGDLITTCMSGRSRNRWMGEEIGRGRKPEEVLGSTEMVVEGFETARCAHELAGRHKVEMPITEEIYNVLHRGRDPREATRSLMGRSPKEEFDL
jgi:glycerol-3-phosphate dehydrogenase (NAD(P)+)